MAWALGESVLWRARPQLAGEFVGYVFCANVVQDSAEAIVLFQAAGAPGMRRVGRRGGPRGRSLIERDWSGAHEPFVWRGPSTLRLHLVGTNFSVLRRWNSEAARCEGWYINLEQSWRRTRLGFDGRDDVLDVEVADDLSTWRLKDEDELESCVEVGDLTVAEARAIRRSAEHVVERLENRAWPFREDAWAHLVPDPRWPVPLSADWSSLDPAALR